MVRYLLVSSYLTAVKFIIIVSSYIGEITNVEPNVVCEAIDHVVQQNLISTEVETNNLMVNMAINGKLNQESNHKLGDKNDNFWKTINKDNGLI